MEISLLVWPHFTCKQMTKNGKTFFENYFIKKNEV